MVCYCARAELVVVKLQTTNYKISEILVAQKLLKILVVGKLLDLVVSQLVIVGLVDNCA